MEIDVQSYAKEQKEKELSTQSNKALEASQTVKPVEEPTVKEPEPVLAKEPVKEAPVELPKQEGDLSIDVEDAQQMTPMNDYTNDDENGTSLMERIWGLKEDRYLFTNPRSLKDWDKQHRGWLGKTYDIGRNLVAGVAESGIQTSKIPAQLSVMFGTAAAKTGVSFGETMIRWGNDSINNIDYFLKEFSPFDAERDTLTYSVGGVIGDIGTSLGLSAAAKKASSGTVKALTKEAEIKKSALSFSDKAFKPVEETAKGVGRTKIAFKMKAGFANEDVVKALSQDFLKDAAKAESMVNRISKLVSDVPMHFVMSKDVASMVESRIAQYRDQTGQVDMDKWLKDGWRNLKGIAAYGTLAWLTEAKFGLGWILKNANSPTSELTLEAIKSIANGNTWLSKMATKYTFGTYVMLSTAKEGATEMLQEIEQIGAEWAFRLKEKNPEDGTIEYREKNFKDEAVRVLVSGVLGGVMGGTMSTGHVVMQKRDFVNKVSPFIKEAHPDLTDEQAARKAKDIFDTYYKNMAPKLASEINVKTSFATANGVEFQKFQDFIADNVNLPQWKDNPDLKAKDVSVMATQYSDLLYNLCNSVGLPMNNWEEHIGINTFTTKDGTVGLQFLYDGKPLTQNLEYKETHKELQETYNENNDDIKGEWELREVSSFSKELQNVLKDKGYTTEKVWVRAGTEHVVPKDVMPVVLQAKYTAQMARENISIDKLADIRLPAKANGAYDVALSSILINPFKANETTLSHEFGHFFFETMYTAYRNKLLSDKMEDDFTGLLTSLKINPQSQPHLGTRASELLADVFSAYASGSALKGKVSEALKTKGIDKPIDGIMKAYKADAYRAWKNANRPDIVISPATVDFMRNILGKDIGAIQAQVSDKVDIPEGVSKEDYAKQVVSERNPEVVYNTHGEDVSYAQPMAMNEPKSRKSRVYTKTLEALNLTSDPDLSLEYTPINNTEQAAKATQLVEQDPAKVKEMIITGKTDGVLSTALMMAYQNYMMEKGNYKEAVRMLEMRSDEQTRRGQEIQFERMSKFGKNDITQADFWFRALRVAKLEAAIEKFPNFKNKSQADFAQWKKNLTENLAKALNEGKITLKEAIDKINVEVDSNLLYQTDVVFDTYAKAYDWVHDMMDKALNIQLSENEITTLNEEANKLRQEASTFDGKVITDEQAEAIGKLQKVIKESKPSSNLKIITSTISRLNLLANPGTLLTNIISNTGTAIPEMITRRLINQKMTGYVDKGLMKNKYSYAMRVFDKSGMSVPTMRPEDFKKEATFRGEHTISSEGEGKVRSIARFGEAAIFKWGLGAPDVITKTFAFNDSANIQIAKYVDTQLPNGSVAEKTELANKLFEDVWAITPSSDIAVDIRNKAILDAETATYTNKSKFANYLSKVRSGLNEVSGDLMLGDLIAPFVATPANVVSLSLQYSVGSLFGLANVKTILKDIRRQNLSDISRNSITYAVRNGLGGLLAVALGSLIDDDDYIPPYEACSQAERELIKAKNGVFNSIKFGDTYVSLDLLGVLGTPLAGVLNAKRKGGLGFFGAVGYQLTQLPIVDSAANFAQWSATMSKDSEKGLQDAYESVINNIVSRTIPAFVSTIANTTDPYVRDSKGLSFLEKTYGKFAPWSMPETQSYVSGGTVEKSGMDIFYRFLLGSRVKVEKDSPLVQALETLDLNGNLPYIGDFTNRGRFKDYTAEQKLRAKAKFAKEFKKQGEQLVRSSSYIKATSEDQKQMISKLRSRIVKGL